MPSELVATVWDDGQVLCESPPDHLAVRLWAAVAQHLIGPDADADVSIDCDDPETEARLRVAGFQTADVGAASTVEVEESVALERAGTLGVLVAIVLRLPREAPLGALATAGGRGVDLDLGVSLDVWGDGALTALRLAASGVGLILRERAADEEES